jgi:hypothetical protein
VRIKQDELRLGTSVGRAQNRYEVGLTGRYRRRPSIQVDRADGTNFVLDEAQDADVSLLIVDRRSLYKTRAFARWCSAAGASGGWRSARCTSGGRRSRPSR